MPSTPADARAVLGVGATADYGTIKAAYRTLIAKAHPDIAGAGATERAAELNAAYRLLSRAHRAGTEASPEATSPRQPSAPTPPARPAEPMAAGVPSDVRRIGDDTLVLHSLPGEAFRRLTEAAHGLGEISYVDRSAAIFEAVVRLDDGTPASLVVSLQWRAHDSTCEAFITLEALDRAESLDVGGVVEQLAHLLPDDASAPSI